MEEKQSETNETKKTKLSKTARFTGRIKQTLENVINEFMTEFRKFTNDPEKDDIGLMRNKLTEIYGAENEELINAGMDYYMSVRIVGSKKLFDGKPDKFFAGLQNRESRDEIIRKINNKEPLEIQPPDNQKPDNQK